MADYKFSKIDSFSISKKPEKWTRRKSPIVYGQWGSVTAPLAYITKPKWIEQAEFDKFIEALDLTIAAPKPNDPLGNLEGELGSSHMQGTPKAQGHEADNFNSGGAR